MSYEEKYNEILEWARKNKARLNGVPIEEVLPELAESEDERIRKGLVKLLTVAGEAYVVNSTGIKKDSYLAYLKKLKDKAFIPDELVENYKRFCEQGGRDVAAFINAVNWQKEQKPVETWPNLSNCIHDCKNCLAKCLYRKEENPEQKPAESISQPTVQGKGVYKICPRCKERMVRDDSMVYTSMPPQYRYECPKCGESECDTVMYDNPEMEEQKPANE